MTTHYLLFLLWFEYLHCVVLQPQCSDGVFTISNLTSELSSDGLSGIVTGRVDVCYNGTFSSVCDLNWDEVDAMILCENYLSNTLGVSRDLIGK